MPSFKYTRWFISLQVVDCISNLYIATAILRLLAQGLNKISIKMLAAKLLIVRGVVDGINA